MFILIGCAGFIFFFLYEINEVRWRRPAMKPLYAIGLLLLAVATLLPVITGGLSARSPAAAVIFGLLSAVALGLFVYTLFFALPFKATYLEGGANKVYDKGMYALCRHPGQIWFLMFYFFFWLFTGLWQMLCCFLLFGFLNTLYIVLQDRWSFPLLFDDYQTYKETTPFLFPNPRSIQRSFKGM